jgi:tRNA pseudouridine13 synthase
LTKQSLGTPEAIQAIARRWKLPQRAIAYAGLKDKHALTKQYVTIHRGPRRNLSQTNLTLDYVGETSRPIHASDITANRFLVVVRDLSPDQVERAVEAIAALDLDGLPNYFDNQRFGSLGQSGEFIAKPWCLGDYSRALWLALADPNAHDGSQDQAEKRALREQWGDWSACLNRVTDAQRLAILRYLANRPGDFRRAIALFPQHLRSIWLAAFQSHLWNQILAALVWQTCEPRQCTSEKIAGRELPFFAGLDATQRQRLQSVSLPLPSARLHWNDQNLEPLYQQALAAEGLELRQVRVKYPRDSFFSKGERAAVVRPADFVHELAADEHYRRAQKLVLRFSLPRGAYATILVKRIAGEAPDDGTSDD